MPVLEAQLPGVRVARDYAIGDIRIVAEWLLADGTIAKVTDTIPASWMDDDYTPADHADSMRVDGAVELSTAYIA